MKKIYILAVSGGVDSVVLLHKLMSVKPPLVDYIVAHFDHGIRPDSRDDMKFVSELAKRYSIPFESKRATLGAKASEETARNSRYEFLYEIKKKYKAEAIITAHHQDDVIETMLLNMLRGTSPRGLVGFSQQDIIRPLLDTPKATLVDYAAQHSLQWREDSTNSDLRYKRNYIRLKVMPNLHQEDRQRLLRIRTKMLQAYQEIDHLCSALLVQMMQRRSLVRARFVILPISVAHEVLAFWLRLERIGFDQKSLHRLVLAIKTAGNGQKIMIEGGHYFYVDKGKILLIVSVAHV